MKYIVIGLGNFGTALSARLTEMGHEVIGIDQSKLRVQQCKDIISTTMSCDTNDIDSLRSLPINEADAVIVAIGEDFGASVMTTALLKQLNVKRIIGRAINDLHKTVLEAIGVSDVLSPERESAERFAKKLQLKGIYDSYTVTEKYQIVEYPVPEVYWGSTIEEVNLEERFGVKLITVKRNVPVKNILGGLKEVPEVIPDFSSELILLEGDIFLVFGQTNNIQEMFSFK